MPESIIEITENKTFSLNLTARANPPPTYSCSASNVSETDYQTYSISLYLKLYSIFRKKFTKL